MPEDTLDAFGKSWGKMNTGFHLLTQRNIAAKSDYTVDPISLSWKDLSKTDKARILNVTPSSRNVFDQLDNWIKTEPDYEQNLKDWANSHFFLPPSVNFGSELHGNILELLSCDFWDKTAAPKLQQAVINLFNSNMNKRVICLDLGSLDEQKQLFITAEVALAALWAEARKQWSRALTFPPNHDSRCPVFVVIDEAHNIAPEKPLNDAGAGVTEILTRIAMEGRKFGLFLILVTQRPSRVSSNLLSQCDNLCLMKMSNPADVELVKQRFGFIPGPVAEKGAFVSKRGDGFSWPVCRQQGGCCQGISTANR